jgi:hypothetical protein
MAFSLASSAQIDLLCILSSGSVLAVWLLSRLRDFPFEHVPGAIDIRA